MTASALLQRSFWKAFCIFEARCQYSCLENPRDRGAWWAAINGVAELDTTKVTQQQQQQLRLKMLKPIGNIVALTGHSDQASRVCLVSIQYKNRAMDMWQILDHSYHHRPKTAFIMKREKRMYRSPSPHSPPYHCHMDTDQQNKTKMLMHLSKLSLRNVSSSCLNYSVPDKHISQKYIAYVKKGVDRIW